MKSWYGNTVKCYNDNCKNFINRDAISRDFKGHKVCSRQCDNILEDQERIKKDNGAFKLTK